MNIAHGCRRLAAVQTKMQRFEDEQVRYILVKPQQDLVPFGIVACLALAPSNHAIMLGHFRDLEIQHASMTALVSCKALASVAYIAHVILV